MMMMMIVMIMMLVVLLVVLLVMLLVMLLVLTALAVARADALSLCPLLRQRTTKQCCATEVPLPRYTHIRTPPPPAAGVCVRSFSNLCC